MSSDTSHLSRDDLARLLEETLTGHDQQRIESHLEVCRDCRDIVTGQGGDDRWWKAAATYLRNADGECATPSRETAGQHETAVPQETDQQRETAEQREISTVLSATDDPRMLGRLGGYEIAGIIGSGGMGIVLKGLDVSLNRYVAIKVLRPSQAPSASARVRFEREGRAAASIVHENVIAIHGVAETNGVPYLVMPYVRGESLATSIVRRGPLRLEEMLRIGCQVAGGLAAAHEQGVIHRDVKPSNILLENGLERLKLTDFGLARAIDDAGLTRSGTLAGTPEYMSPEQVRGEVLDARSDLFSLGSVLWTMSTARAPFVADSCYGVIRRIVECDAPSVRRFDPSLPIWWEDVVSKLMRKRRSERYSSASEVERVLKGCLAHVQDTRIPLPKEIAPSSLARRLGRRGMLSAFAVALLLAGICFAFADNWFESDSERQPDSIRPAASHREPAATATQWDDETEEQLARIRDSIIKLRRSP